MNPRPAAHHMTRVARSVVEEVSARTGLAFAYDGTTGESLPPGGGAQRPAVQVSRYGDRWAPVLVSWATGATQRGLAGDVAGLGGAAAVGHTAADEVFVTGTVLLDAEQVRPASVPRAQRRIARAVVLHELGHLVGLAHVNDPAEVMYPTAGATDFGAGDLSGLAILGAGPCRPDV